jgi:SAM-dependent methyltransferase
MARISTPPGDGDKPDIDREKVAAFFEARARRIGELGPVKAVIYQDKHPTLAQERDALEKVRVLPLLDLNSSVRFLDVGCGTGRWYEALRGKLGHYHGVDASAGLLAYARSALGEDKARRFTELTADRISLAALGETLPFDRILCAGLMIYLNDDEVLETLARMTQVASPVARIVLREPVAIGSRLSLVDHYSDDLETSYNSIYRTDAEWRHMFAQKLESAGFHLVEEADLFSSDLNNRKETRQRLYILDRGR